MENNLKPPFDLQDNSIDVLYCISVFTHLSREMHLEWINEIKRVLKPDGIFICSLHGDKPHIISNLLPDEATKFMNGEFIQRGHVKEGSRIYTAYHSDKFIIDEFLVGFKIIEKSDVDFSQSIWCAHGLVNHETP